MYNIDYSNIKKEKSFFNVFLFAGIWFFLLIILFIFLFAHHEKAYTKSVPSTKTEIITYTNDNGDKMYSRAYEYNVDGESYVCRSNMKTSKKPDTNSTDIYYKEDDPSNCYIKEQLSVLLLIPFFILLLISIIFATIGLVGVKKYNKKIKIIKYLSSNGKLIKGIPYTAIESNVTINNKTLKKIKITYTTKTGETRVLYSEPIYNKYVPEEGLADLLIDEENPQNYFIDLNIEQLKEWVYGKKKKKQKTIK